LDCSEYIGKYLAAQADDELAPLERHVADEHLGKCAACRAILAEERSLKALLRRNAGIVRTPPDVRMRIRAALGEMAETSHPNRTAVAHRANIARTGFDPGRAGVIRRSVARLSRNGLWASAGGVAAVLIVTLAIFAGRATNRIETKSNPAVPAFDLAISKYLTFQRDFAPNLPPEAYSKAGGAVYAWVQDSDPVQRVATEAAEKFDDVARAYREMNMPDDLIDLSPAGYALSGGRDERLPDGRPITYTLYSGGTGTILSICYPDASMAAPVGAINWLGMRSFYEYKGYSICMSFYPTGHFVSILLSRMPVRQLLDYVAMADATAAGN
jgi:anti-sigma factor RsiW